MQNSDYLNLNVNKSVTLNLNNCQLAFSDASLCPISVLMVRLVVVILLLMGPLSPRLVADEGFIHWAELVPRREQTLATSLLNLLSTTL